MAQLQTSTVSGNLNVTGSLTVTGSSTFLSTLSGTSAQFVAITCSNFSPAITISPAGATNQIQFNSGSALSADPNFVWDNVNDRLGVGTSTPNFTLSVTGTLGVSDASVIDVSSTSAALRVTQRGTGESLRIEDSTNPDSTPFVISSTGQVGIGTGSPQALTHISGTGDVRIEGGSNLVIRSTSQNFNGQIRFIDTGSNPRATLYAGGTDIFRIADSAIDRLIVNSVGNVGIGTDSTQAGFARLVIRPQAGNIIGLTQVSNTSSIVAWNDSGVSNTLRVAGNPLVFTGNGGSGAEHMRIDSAGNVGIGTTSPNTSLSVKGAGVGIVDIGQWTPGTNYGVIYLNGDFAVNNNYNILSSPTDKRLILNRPTGEDIRFRMNNVDQMTLDTNGNLGIGTTSPATKLDVSGTISINGVPVINTLNNNTGIWANFRVLSNDSTAVQDGMYINFNSTGGAGANLRFYASGTTERMRIDASTGHVGIGTSAPTDRLSVGASSEFRVNSTGNLVRINNVAYSWPSSANPPTVDTFLSSDGSGNLTWKKPSSFSSLTSATSASNFTFNSTSDIFLINATAAITGTLPSAVTVGAGKIINIKRTGTFALAIDAAGTQQIDGSTAVYVLNTSNQSVTLVSDGSNWFIL